MRKKLPLVIIFAVVIFALAAVFYYLVNKPGSSKKSSAITFRESELSAEPAKFEFTGMTLLSPWSARASGAENKIGDTVENGFYLLDESSGSFNVVFCTASENAINYDEMFKIYSYDHIDCLAI